LYVYDEEKKFYDIDSREFFNFLPINKKGGFHVFCPKNILSTKCFATADRLLVENSLGVLAKCLSDEMFSTERRGAKKLLKNRFWLPRKKFLDNFVFS
jgi:hypothetical protein